MARQGKHVRGGAAEAQVRYICAADVNAPVHTLRRRHRSITSSQMTVGAFNRLESKVHVMVELLQIHRPRTLHVSSTSTNPISWAPFSQWCYLDYFYFAYFLWSITANQSVLISTVLGCNETQIDLLKCRSAMSEDVASFHVVRCPFKTEKTFREKNSSFCLTVVAHPNIHWNPLNTRSHPAQTLCSLSLKDSVLVGHNSIHLLLSIIQQHSRKWN